MIESQYKIVPALPSSDQLFHKLPLSDEKVKKQLPVNDATCSCCSAASQPLT